MSLAEWLLIHTASIIFWLWVLIWGGANWLMGWKSLFFIDWFAIHWNVEQIRLYAFCILFFQIIWFLIGLFNPAYRGFF